MKIIHHMTAELTRRETDLPLDAVQGDGSTRAVKLSLLENGAPWEVPAEVTAAVAFRKADGHRGLYDTLPDGSKAVTIDGSTVTAVIAPQVLSCPGEVSAAVVFYGANLQQLATFPFAVRVQANPAAGQEVSNDYYSYSSMEDVSRAVEDALASLAQAHSSMEKLRWNQLAADSHKQTHNGISVVTEGTRTTVTGTAAGDDAFPGIATVKGLTGGHTVLVRLPVLPGVARINLFEYDADTNVGSQNYLKSHYSSSGTVLRFALQAGTEKVWIGLQVKEGATVNTSGHLNLFDLTQMFGAGNEPSAEEFAKLYPADRYDYCGPVEAPAPYLSVIRGMLSAGTPTNLTGRKFLVMGDSLSAANKWQKELEARGAAYTNHALGGAGIVQIVDGGSNSNGSLSALTAAEVTGKDAIIFFGGQNNHKLAHGKVGDVYPADETVAGCMQYAINRIYSLLAEADNLTCRVLVVTPYCFGASDYNTDAFTMDGAGLAQTIEDVANYNGIPVWNAYKNSGINPTTLAVWGAAGNDHVHLSSAGYAHLGKLIAAFADREVTA